MRGEHRVLGGELGEHVAAAVGMHRVFLVEFAPGDIAVDDDRGDVDEAAHAVAGGRCGQVARREHVRPPHLVVVERVGHQGRGVDDGVRATEQVGELRGPADVGGTHSLAVAAQVDAEDLDAAPGEVARERPADEAAGAGDQDRSAAGAHAWPRR
jgi:hypothetical protein